MSILLQRKCFLFGTFHDNVKATKRSKIFIANTSLISVTAAQVKNHASLGNVFERVLTSLVVFYETSIYRELNLIKFVPFLSLRA